MTHNWETFSLIPQAAQLICRYRPLRKFTLPAFAVVSAKSIAMGKSLMFPLRVSQRFSRAQAFNPL
jgi:hypothetical protein